MTTDPLALILAVGRALVAAALVALSGCVGSVPSHDLADFEDLPPKSGPEIQQVLDEALQATFERRLNLQDHAAWQILHGALAFKTDFQVERERGGELIPAVDYLLGGGTIRGWTTEPGVLLDEASGSRGLRALLETGSKTGQGHSDQWLAILAQCDLEPTRTIRIGSETFTMADFIAQVQWDLPRNLDREFSWTLIGLTSYLPTDAEWIAQDGQTWSIERLMAAELEHDLAASACGGTHRLIGLAMTLNRHLAGGGHLDGVWGRADEAVQRAIDAARRHQNPDGSFSSNYFQRPGSSPDLAQNLGTTGHILEFLTLAATEEQLREPWIEQAVTHLCDLFRKTRHLDLECGALYHAAHGLALYRERRFSEAGGP